MILIHKWIGCALPAVGDFTRILFFRELRKAAKKVRKFDDNIEKSLKFTEIWETNKEKCFENHEN